MIAFVLAHWAYLLTGSPAPLDWGHAARDALEIFLPLVALALLLLELERLRLLCPQPRHLTSNLLVQDLSRGDAGAGLQRYRGSHA